MIIHQVFGNKISNQTLHPISLEMPGIPLSPMHSYLSKGQRSFRRTTVVCTRNFARSFLCGHSHLFTQWFQIRKLAQVWSLSKRLCFLFWLHLPSFILASFWLVDVNEYSHWIPIYFASKTRSFNCFHNSLQIKAIWLPLQPCWSLLSPGL